MAAYGLTIPKTGRYIHPSHTGNTAEYVKEHYEMTVATVTHTPHTDEERNENHEIQTLWDCPERR